MEFFRPNLDPGVPVTEFNPLQEACPYFPYAPATRGGGGGWVWGWSPARASPERANASLGLNDAGTRWMAVIWETVYLRPCLIAVCEL